MSNYQDQDSDIDDRVIVNADVLPRAREFAAKNHKGQVDKAGKPYIEHLARVAASVAKFGYVTEAVAWLHDVVEDTDVTVRDIRREFGDSIGDAVAILTRPDKMFYREYIEAITHYGNSHAITVKKADLMDNLMRDPEPSLARRYLHALKIFGVENLTEANNDN